MTMGYGGIIVEEFDLWQGIIIQPAYEEIGKRFLETARKAAKMFGGLAVRLPMNSLDEETQRVLACLTAALIDGAIKNVELQMAGTIWAIQELTKIKYFVVKGRKEGSGTVTDFEIMPFFVASTEAARDYINGRSDVLAMKERLVDQQIKRFKSGNYRRYDA